MSLVQACRLVGCPRASYYRHLNPCPKRTPIPQVERVQPHALSATEREAILAVLNSAENADLSVCQAFYRHWDAGQYLASKSSWYRVARAAGQVGDRRRQATGLAEEDPGAGRDRPVAGVVVGHHQAARPRSGASYFHLYVITDIYSRKRRRLAGGSLRSGRAGRGTDREGGGREPRQTAELSALR